jgi:hypothetical protein
LYGRLLEQRALFVPYTGGATDFRFIANANARIVFIVVDKSACIAYPALLLFVKLELLARKRQWHGEALQYRLDFYLQQL